MGIHSVYVPKKTVNQLYFLTIEVLQVSERESCCGKGTAIENEAIRESMKNNNRTALLSKLHKTLPCLIFACDLLYFVFHYKSSTDEATNQMLIYITVTIYKMRSNCIFPLLITLHSALISSTYNPTLIFSR